MRLHLATLLLAACAACGDVDFAPPGAPHLAVAQQALTSCAGAWSATQAYAGGSTVSRQGQNYRANWWTQGDDPATHNGGPNSGQPWTAQGACQGGVVASAPAAPPATPAAPAAPPAAAAAAPGGVFFSPYKDVTISANWNTNVISTNVSGGFLPLVRLPTGVQAYTWAFATGECGAETWGGIPGAALAQANVPPFAAAKMGYILSTGGAAGAFTCGSDAGFTAFLERYWSDHLLGVDFDIEAGQSQATIQALVQRAKAAQNTPRYSKLRYSFTVATLGGNAVPSLGQTGEQVVKAIKDAGLARYKINLMAMDYGSATAGNCVLKGGQCDMGASAVQAAVSLNQQYAIPYGHIELTPMVGGNDTAGETFALADVDTVMAFAKKVGLGGVHFWSLDRDMDSAPGPASPTANSYGLAGALGFTKRFVSRR